MARRRRAHCDPPRGTRCPGSSRGGSSDHSLSHESGTLVRAEFRSQINARARLTITDPLDCKLRVGFQVSNRALDIVTYFSVDILVYDLAKAQLKQASDIAAKAFSSPEEALKVRNSRRLLLRVARHEPTRRANPIARSRALRESAAGRQRAPKEECPPPLWRRGRQCRLAIRLCNPPIALREAVDVLEHRSCDCIYSRLRTGFLSDGRFSELLQQRCREDWNAAGPVSLDVTKATLLSADDRVV